MEWSSMLLTVSGLLLLLQDFSRDVLRIDAIPSKRLDTIKEWLTSMKIKYYESKMNLAWKPILKHIQEDPQQFVDEVRNQSSHPLKLQSVLLLS
jgi:nucleosome binding factor SPN SPT16 subunit